MENRPMGQSKNKFTLTLTAYDYQRLARLSRATGIGMATLARQPVTEWIRSKQFTHQLEEAEKQPELEIEIQIQEEEDPEDD